MASSEENGVVFGEDGSEKAIKNLKSDAAVEEKNSSNNSTSENTKQQQHVPKSKRFNGTYKQPGYMSGDQSVRREELLEKMKGKQYMYNAHTQSFLNAIMRPSMDGRDIKSKVFKNQLMMSENMDEVPTTFARKWLMVVCPLGSRCLVVASRGYTGAYTKTGYHIISHPSSLPMGNKMFQGYGPCVLDCIYCNETETYYVLDMMCWDGQALYDCDAPTRFKLLTEKIREHDLSRHSPMNPYPFIPLKTFTPTKSNIHGAVTMAPYVIDGLIFYHKDLCYGPGPTPLMLWMTLDRLPSKLKIEIPEMGIISSVSYNDPISLALAHGVSPAIISQVYPGANIPVAPGRGGGSNQNGRGMQGRSYGQQSFSAPPFNQGGQRMRGGGGAAGPMQGFGPGDFAFLSEMMMGLSLQGGNQGMYRNYGGNPQGRGYQRHLNGNNNNTSNDYYQGMGYRKQYSHPFYKSKQQKKRKQQSSQGKSDEPKTSNWEEPHGVMRSQWMENKPEDFEENYLTCICPMSKRRIIVAAKGSTCLFNKFGKLIDTFTSTLPNGSPSPQSKTSIDMTILDCLWCGSFQKFFVIDVMHWRSQPFYDAEAEFRFFWMSDKISGVKLKSGKREYGLEILPKYPSDKDSLTDALSKADFKVDGLLSLNRRCPYRREAGTHALWIKLDLLDEVLGFPPPPKANFKPSTEKERKQRAYFIGLNKNKEKAMNNGSEESTDGDKEESNDDAE